MSSFNSGWFDVKSDHMDEELAKWITAPLSFLGTVFQDTADKYRDRDREKTAEKETEGTSVVDPEQSDQKEQQEKSFLILGFKQNKEAFKMEAKPSMTFENIIDQIQEQKIDLDQLLVVGLDGQKEKTGQVQLPYPAMKKGLEKQRAAVKENLLGMRERNRLSAQQRKHSHLRQDKEQVNPMKELQDQTQELDAENLQKGKFQESEAKPKPIKTKGTPDLDLGR